MTCSQNDVQVKCVTMKCKTSSTEAKNSQAIVAAINMRWNQIYFTGQGKVHSERKGWCFSGEMTACAGVKPTHCLCLCLKQRQIVCSNSNIH